MLDVSRRQRAPLRVIVLTRNHNMYHKIWMGRETVTFNVDIIIASKLNHISFFIMFSLLRRQWNYKWLI